jgi:hypothetical protein
MVDDSTNAFLWRSEDRKRVQDRASDVRRAEANAEYSRVGSSRTDPTTRQAVENYQAAVRLANKHVAQDKAEARRFEANRPSRKEEWERAGQVHTHSQAHSSPTHHIGACDAACRAGKRPHSHRG